MPHQGAKLPRLSTADLAIGHHWQLTSQKAANLISVTSNKGM